MPHNLVTGSGLRKLVSVPMVTYHSIADASDGWQFRHLSCPVSTFESHLKALRWANFQTISLRMLYGYMAEGKEIPSRSVVLTFDDGYLDNWVYAYPLLKKYGLHGTIFVNPDFVDPFESLRPNLEDVWSGRISVHGLPTCGFLSWQEMMAMESSGYIDIQSHALTHTWYFSSAEIIDFHHPGDPYPWLAWNAHPERKHLWMTEDQHTFVPWGTPVYQHKKSLTTRRYFPDQNLDTVLTNFVRNHGSETFFHSFGWRQQLEQVATDYRQTHDDCGYFESDAEYQARLHHELAGSKQLIERQLDKTVDFLCWPGGGYNDTSAEISKEVGYLASAHSSHDLDIKKNRFDEDPSRWSRISPPAFHWSETRVEYKGGLYLICLLNSVQGSYLYTMMCKAFRLPFKLSQWAGASSLKHQVSSSTWKSMMT
jgi:peptidoglycan/xylan/chitin deacetylase (PgdA/CDA1 family)